MLQEFASTIQFHSLQLQTSQQTCYEWQLSALQPFDELLISWNAYRPLLGHYVLLSRVLIRNQWSPWLLYAVWGSQEQYSFYETPSQAPVRSFQDQVELLEGETATGFCIRIEALKGAILDNFYDIYTCTSYLRGFKPCWNPPMQSFPSLPIPNISQLCLAHPRSHSFCSPTSTTAVLQYLLVNPYLQPIQFAKQVYDAGFDIYGNWAFNTAQGFIELGLQWRCFYARMTKIEWLWQLLKQQLPIVISIKDAQLGSSACYSNGHLLVIKGYHVETQQFLCMDPALPSYEQTNIAYSWQNLIEAWANRHYLAYFFLPR